jgi:CubicO group peptidase (beta-lactamase class C family)
VRAGRTSSAAGSARLHRWARWLAAAACVAVLATAWAPGARQISASDADASGAPVAEGIATGDGTAAGDDATAGDGLAYADDATAGAGLAYADEAATGEAASDGLAYADETDDAAAGDVAYADEVDESADSADGADGESSDADDETVAEEVGEAVDDWGSMTGNYQVSDEQTLQESLDRYISNNYKAAGLPGVAVAVVSSEGVLYVGTFGDCTSSSDTFAVGSLSKSFTAVAIMQLVERGQVDLDAPANTYLPDSTLPDSVTIRSLLNQTSGFGYYDSLEDETVGETEGTFSYSNANYDTLGRVIENVTGMSYADYLQENIFGPLGMINSSADPSAREQALGHRNYFGFAITDGFVHEDTDDAWGQSPSGYICSSIDDMARYLQMYLRDGEGILSSESIDEMFRDVVPTSDDGWYSMGWMPSLDEDDEVTSASHPGQVENAVADMCIFPQDDLAVVILGDESDYFGGNDEFWEMAGQIEDIVAGYDAFDIDPTERIDEHIRVDVTLFAVVVLCLLPILLFRRWRRMMENASGVSGALRVWIPLVLIHVALPIELALLPGQFGVKWRDLATFVPDVALVLLLCIALLTGCGIVKVCLTLIRTWQKTNTSVDGLIKDMGSGDAERVRSGQSETDGSGASSTESG